MSISVCPLFHLRIARDLSEVKGIDSSLRYHSHAGKLIQHNIIITLLFKVQTFHKFCKHNFVTALMSCQLCDNGIVKSPLDAHSVKY